MQAILKLELIPMPLPLAETTSHSMRSGNKSSVAEFLTEKAKVPGVNHTSRKCCFVHRWLIVVGKPEKGNIQRLFGLHVDFVLKRGSLWYSIVIGSNPLKQRKEVGAPRTWRRLWEEYEEMFHCKYVLHQKRRKRI